MAEVTRTEDERVLHYGPVYGMRSMLGDSLAACGPGQQSNTLTTNKGWVTCEKCKSTEAYRNGN